VKITRVNLNKYLVKHKIKTKQLADEIDFSYSILCKVRAYQFDITKDLREKLEDYFKDKEL